MNHINNLNMLFLQLIATKCQIVENERVELLHQNLPDSYDQLIINITNNNTLTTSDLKMLLPLLLKRKAGGKIKMIG